MRLAAGLRAGPGVIGRGAASRRCDGSAQVKRGMRSLMGNFMGWPPTWVMYAGLVGVQGKNAGRRKEHSAIAVGRAKARNRFAEAEYGGVKAELMGEFLNAERERAPMRMRWIGGDRKSTRLNS